MPRGRSWTCPRLSALAGLPSPCAGPPAVFVHPQDAQRKELDLRAPVSKQRAKRFNLEEELKVGPALLLCSFAGPCVGDGCSPQCCASADECCLCCLAHHDLPCAPW